MGKLLLNLSTAFDRPVIRIDGVDYPLLERGDLGIVDQMRLWQMYGRVAQIRAKSPDDIAETDGAVIGAALDTVLQIILPDVPNEVLERLREPQKLAILESFTQAAEPTTPETLPPESQPTTAT